MKKTETKNIEFMIDINNYATIEYVDGVITEVLLKVDGGSILIPADSIGTFLDLVEKVEAEINK